jgi:dipeptidyl aminopeptidase/acylaminoacyl peptidase
MVARFVFLSALVVVGVSAGHANTQPSAAELSFTVRLRAAVTKAAVCVAQTTDPNRARRLTGLAESSTGDWSSDGQTLAVADGDPPKGGIHLYTADGSGTRAATRPRPNELDSAPTWSPDGTQIAFVRYVFFVRGGADYGRAGVWVSALDSRAERQLSRRLAGTLDWSPTGDLIAADVGGEFKTDIDLVRPSGGVERTIRVGSAASFDDGASWSPDGTRLAVGDGLVVDRSGHEVGRYAPAPGRDYVLRLPAWSPDRDSVVYVRALTWVAARTNIRVTGLGDLYLGSVTGRDPADRDRGDRRERAGVAHEHIGCGRAGAAVHPPRHLAKGRAPRYAVR